VAGFGDKRVLRYRNINFNSLNMLSTMFKMVIVDASINAKQGINALKRTENLKMGLKALHSIWSNRSKRTILFKLEISISEMRTHLYLFSVILEMKLRFFGPPLHNTIQKMILLIVRSLRLYFYAIAATTG
jgi:hypothetical protein